MLYFDVSLFSRKHLLLVIWYLVLKTFTRFHGYVSSSARLWPIYNCCRGLQAYGKHNLFHSWIYLHISCKGCFSIFLEWICPAVPSVILWIICLQCNLILFWTKVQSDSWEVNLIFLWILTLGASWPSYKLNIKIIWPALWSAPSLYLYDQRAQSIGQPFIKCPLIEIYIL